MELNDKELQFYEELEIQLQKAGVFYNITYNILSDGTINFGLDGIGQIGRVKIRGRKTKMQILQAGENGNVNVLWIDNAPLDDMIDRIYEWVNYAKCLEQQKYSNYTQVVNMNKFNVNKSEKKKSKAPIIVAAVVGLGIIGSAGNNDNDKDDTNRREPKETTAITTTVTAETEWDIWENEETTVALDFVENSDVITLVAGQQGKYGKMITYNKNTEFEESFYAYYVPYGTYKVTNIDEYQTQVGVYTDETIINENGWEEIADAIHADVVKPNESITITVPPNYHVDIPEPSKIVLELIEEYKETETVTEAIKETTATTMESPATTTVPKSTADTSPTIYITPTGEKYHYDNTCNGGTYKESTLNQAERLHLEPCNKCVLG